MANMRVVQLIDSLEIGGAERMAVNIANGIAKTGFFSALVVTRNEGLLKSDLLEKVKYKFLKRKGKIDFNALFAFKKFIKSNEIEIIHAHGSSIFFAIMTKIMCPSIRLVWHDHNGNRLNAKKNNFFIILFSLLYDTVFVVNEHLEDWAKKKLFVKKVFFLPNFSSPLINKKLTVLKGDSEKKIVCLANLRHPKNHLVLLKAYVLSDAKKNNWTLHLIGKDSEDGYSKELKEFITTNNLVNNVYMYGSCEDAAYILSQAKIGVLTSLYEGFPVSLIEYGIASLAVITSNVGYCEKLVKNKINGLVFESDNVLELTECFNKYINNRNYIDSMSAAFHKFVDENYSESIIVKKILLSYKNIL